jgi:hypothetical protein
MELEFKSIIEHPSNKEEVSGKELAKVTNYHFSENPKKTNDKIIEIELTKNKNSINFDENITLSNQNINVLVNSIQKGNLILEEINSKISNKSNSPSKNYLLNHQMEEDDDYENHKNNLGNINSKKIPDFFDYLKQYKNEEPFFQRRSFQFNPDAFKMFLVANKKQRIQQREGISQAFFLYAYLYLTKEEFENIELVSPTEFSFLKELETNDK